MIATYLLPDTVSCFPSTLHLEITSNKSQLLSYVEIKQVALQFWNFFYLARNEKNPTRHYAEGIHCDLRRDHGERFFQVFFGRWPVSPSHDKQDWGRGERKTPHCGLFHLKILWLFTENFSSEPWPISTCCMTFDETNYYNESIVIVGNKFPHWRRLDFRMV